jgi:ribosomal-protein-alanine N-acetyltransferase
MSERMSDSTSVYEIDGDILVRTVEISDVSMMLRYHSENRAHLTAWEPKRRESYYTQQHWIASLGQIQTLHSMSTGYYLAIIDQKLHKMVGMITVSGIYKSPFYSCDLGYSMAAEAQGQGIMPRALKLVIEYMFRQHNMHRISASYMPHNKRSAAVLEKLGFVKEGYAPSYLLVNGQWQDHVLTALINENWQDV